MYLKFATNFFQRYDKQTLEYLVKCMKYRHASAGELVFEQG